MPCVHSETLTSRFNVNLAKATQLIESYLHFLHKAAENKSQVVNLHRHAAAATAALAADVITNFNLYLNLLKDFFT